ncbi:hypothetical protein C1H46_010720 [Malus baccata]|uniref:RecA family profile 2 domain-containing protein n=1 Tax=Malus baccata TaxID=106549 RepID=A0A540MY75_MALBA|nr:hypothetical protein C1H46_010720 [Malus baccata]
MVRYVPIIFGPESSGKTTLALHAIAEVQIGVYYGNPEVTSGGIALKFFASVRLEILSTGKIKSVKGDEEIGVRVRVRVQKSKLGQGRDKALQYLRENPLFLDEIEKRYPMRRKGIWCFHCFLFWIKVKEVSDIAKEQHQFAPLSPHQMQDRGF